MGLMAAFSRHCTILALPPLTETSLCTLSARASFSKAAYLKSLLSEISRGKYCNKHLLLTSHRKPHSSPLHINDEKSFCSGHAIKSARGLLVSKPHICAAQRPGQPLEAISGQTRMSGESSKVDLSAAVAEDAVVGIEQGTGKDQFQSSQEAEGGGVKQIAGADFRNPKLQEQGADSRSRKLQEQGADSRNPKLQEQGVGSSGERKSQPGKKSVGVGGDGTSSAPGLPSETSSTGPLEMAGFQVLGLSVGGQETCIILPALKIAFDIGRCPQRAVFQETLLISHSHIDHVGGLAFYVGTRDLLGMKPPTVVVPKVMLDSTMRLMQAFRDMDQSDLPLDLVGLQVGEELTRKNNFIVRPFRTYHVVPSQGYLVYSIKNKLKPQFIGLPSPEIKKLKLSGVEITDRVEVPEVAFTGDTTAEFITDPANADVLRAKLLIMETTFLDDSVTVEHARKFGHTHLSEVLPLADKFENEEILFIHFSARYKKEEILGVVENLPAPLKGRVRALTERF